MKKFLCLMLTVLIGFNGLRLSAQSVTVANGTETNSYIPFYGLWMDASQHNQVIYPESMLTDLVGETVNTLMFFFNETPANSWSSTATLSVGTTVASSFSSATHNQSPVSQVYSGSITISGGIVSFVLDSAFTYNGGNLLLDIVTIGGNYSSSTFLGISQPGSSMYTYNTSSAVQNFIPKTMFVTGDCMAPTNLTVDSISQTTALFTWQPGDEETAWEIFVGNGSEDLSLVTWTPVTDTFYEAEGLDPNTFYIVYLRSDCGTASSYEISTTFRTACGLTVVPFIEGFETFQAYTQPTCWQFVNPYVSYSYVYPYINNNNPHSGSRAMYFYTDYYNNPTQVQFAVLPELSEPLTNLQLSVYTKRGAAYSGSFYIGYMTDPTDANTFVPLVTRTGSSMGDDFFHREIVNFSDIQVDPDSTAYIAFGYQCDTYYGWYVDDIEVTLIPDCSTPVGLEALGITTSTATLSWTPGTATTFNVYYKETNDSAYTAELALSDSSLLIEGLTHSSFYQWYVEAVCDDGSITTSEVASFSTSCATIDTLPYSESFEVAMPGATLPYCWTRGNENAENPTIYNYNAYDGNHSLYFYYTNTIAMPQINNEEIDIHNVQLSFYASANTNGTTLQVGVMTNPNVTSSFVPVGNPITLTEGYQLYEVTFSGYSGNGTYIAFKNPDEWQTVYVDMVTLDYMPECSRPELVWAQSIDSSSATIAWSALDGQSGWEFVYGPQGFSPDTVEAILVSAPSYTINDLSVNTSYDVYVRTECDGDFSPWSNVMTFLTLNIAPATVPYACGFEDPAENANWTFVQDGEANMWYIDTAVVTVDNSVYSMYISSDSGVTNSYNISMNSVSWAYRDIQFSDANEFELSFDWLGYGESTYDYMRVYIGNPAPVVAGSLTQPIGSLQLAQLNQSNGWQHESITLDATYKNTTKRLYFMWRNDYTMGTQPPAAVDNVTIMSVACAQPANISLFNVDSTTATIGFTPGNEGDAEWEVMYGVADSTMSVEVIDEYPFTLENLIPGMNYEVYLRTLCADGDTSAWSQVLAFQTECVTINSVPRFWDFEENNIGGTASYPMPACWYRGTASSSYPYVNDYYENAYQGQSSIYFYNYYVNTAIMPAIDTDLLPINTLQVSFYAKASDLSNYDAQLVVGVMSDIYNNNTFVPVDTVNLTETYPIQPYVVMFNNYVGNGNRIAFKSASTSITAYNAVYMDNLTLEEVPSCLPVGNLAMESSDMTSITINWTAGFEESSWNVEYKEVSDSVWNSAVTSEMPFTLDNMTPATLYDIRVQADCGGDLSPWTYTQAYTQVCDTANQCDYSFVLFDSYGDGWNGGHLIVKQNGIKVADMTFTSGNTATFSVTLCDNISTELEWQNSLYNNECSFNMIDPFGTIMYTGNSLSAGTVHTFTANCFSASCPAPTGITVTDVDINSATVSWTPSGDEANWNLEYKEATAANWTVVPVTSTSYTITGLTAATIYKVRVQAECDPINSNPSTYDSTTFATSICSVADQCTYTFTLTDSYGDGWNGGSLTVEQNGINVAVIGMTSGSSTTLNIGLCNGVSTSLLWSSGSYPDEAGFTLVGPDGAQIYTIDDMSAYTTFTFTPSCSGGPAVTDPTVATAPATNIAQTTVTLNGVITNPDNVTITAQGFEWKLSTAADYTVVNATGNAMTYNLGNLTPNTTYTYRAFITFDGTTHYGGNETFTTLEQGQLTEPSATTAAATAITQTTATLNGSISNPDNVTITAQGFEWKATSGGTYTTVNATGSTMTYNLSGLTANTDYTFRAFVTTANGTHYGADLTFTTLEEVVDPCDVPTGLTTGTITHESIAISWDANADVSSWNIQYRPVGGTLNSATATTNSYTITGLAPETQYEIQVQAVCSNGQTSDWSAPVTATTLTGINEHLLNSISLYPNPAKEVVNVQCTMNNVQVKSIEVFDVYGKLLQTVSMTPETTTINVSGLASGMYFVRVTTEEGAVTKSFVKK